MTRRPCPNVFVLQSLLNDDLAEPELAELAEHLDQCDKCREQLNSLVAESGMLPGSDEGCVLDLRAVDDVSSELIAQFDAQIASARQSELLNPRPEGPSRDSPPAATSEVSADSANWRLLKDSLEPPRDPAFLGAIGPYDILGVVGEGGMGVVLKARDTTLDRVVALKILSPILMASSEARERFLREARAAAAIEHENVVSIYAVEQWNDIPYLVLQFVDGLTLHETVVKSGPLSCERVVNYGRQIANGLAAAHQLGLIHRDIKPSNILVVEQTGRVYITDFGLVRALDNVGLTQSGTIAGTPQFMSPEQAEGAGIDERSDLFSLGSVLYFLCTGQPPFSGNTTVSILKQLCDGVPEPMSERREEIPQSLQGVIRKLMARDPEERFGTAQEVVRSLERSHAEVSQTATLEPVTVASRRALILAMVAVGIVAVAAVLPFVIPDGSVRELTGVPGELPSGSTAKAPIEDSDVAEADLSAGSPIRIRGSSEPFVSLESAIAAAKDGDVIELHQDGLIETEPLRIVGKSLTITAAPPHRPILRPRVVSEAPAASFISTDSELTLEHLTIEDSVTRLPRVSGTVWPPERFVVCCTGPMLRVRNCLLTTLGRGALSVYGDCELTNSFIRTTAGPAVCWSQRARRQLHVENCAIVATSLLRCEPFEPPEQPLEVSIHRCSLGTNFVMLLHAYPSRVDTQGSKSPILNVDASQSVISTTTLYRLFAHEPRALSLSALRAGKVFDTLIDWSDNHNVYDVRIQRFWDMQVGNRLKRWDELPSDVESWLIRHNQPVDAAVSTKFVDRRGKGVPETKDDFQTRFDPPIDESFGAVGADIDSVGPHGR